MGFNLGFKELKNLCQARKHCFKLQFPASLNCCHLIPPHVTS